MKTMKLQEKFIEVNANNTFIKRISVTNDTIVNTNFGKSRNGILEIKSFFGTRLLKIVCPVCFI